MPAIDITKFFNACPTPRRLSGSVAELGTHAAQVTWSASFEHDVPVLLHADDYEAFRAFVVASGGWDDEEVESMAACELQALARQWVAGDMREPVGFELTPASDAAQWAEYARQASEGNVSGRLFRGDDGRVFWDISA